MNGKNILILVALIAVCSMCNSYGIAESARGLSEVVPAGPLLTNWVEPELSPPAPEQDPDGQATVDVLVGPDGLVREARLNSSSADSQFDRAVLLAAKQCTFAPAGEGGKSASEWTTLYYVVSTPCAGVESTPKIRQWVQPAYPADARRDNLEGTVVVKVLVSVAGAVDKAQVIKSDDPSLDAAALSAARACQFSPASKDCTPTPAWMALPFEFRNDDK